MGSEHYCLRWNNHQSNLLGVFSQLLHDESLVDVTLACSEGASIRAHKVVLSACSSYFRSLFVDHPSRHPIVILKDVGLEELRTLVDFMYKGEVNVQYCQLPALLKIAESLQVKGLAEMTTLSAAGIDTRNVPEPMEEGQPQDMRECTEPHEKLDNRETREKEERREVKEARERECKESRDGRDNHTRETREGRDLQREREQRDRELRESRGHREIRESRETREVRDSRDHRELRDSRDNWEPRDLREIRDPRELRDTRDPREMPDASPPRISPLLSVRRFRLETSIETPTPTHPPIPKDEPPDEPIGPLSTEEDTVSIRSNGANENIGLNMTINSHSGSTLGPRYSPVEQRLSVLNALPHPGLPHPTHPSLPSPRNEPIAGPSGLPPVQQVPLSLKKEIDWERSNEDKVGEPSTEFRMQHETEYEGSGRGRIEEGDRGYPCIHCGAAFPHQNKLARHILTTHTLESLKYRDAILGRPMGLPMIGQFSEPTYMGMPTEETPIDIDIGPVEPGNVVLCKFCGKSFPDVSSLIAHLPVHTGDRPFKCEFCGKAFKLRHHMKDHCRVHTGERPFRCVLCGKTFSRSTILKAHEKTHYPKYARKFLSPSPVDTEEESPHQMCLDMTCGSPNIPSPIPPRSPTALPLWSPLLALQACRLRRYLSDDCMTYQSRHLLHSERRRCGVCLASFPSSWLLERHAALQHASQTSCDDKPFVCEQCGQSYRYRSAYVKHREQNHRARLPADKLFTCDVCGMQFRYLKSFKKHRLNHTLERLHTKNTDAIEGMDQVTSTNEVFGQCGEMDLSIKKRNRPEVARTPPIEVIGDAEQDSTVDSNGPTDSIVTVDDSTDCKNSSAESENKRDVDTPLSERRRIPVSFASVSSMADSSESESRNDSNKMESTSSHSGILGFLQNDDRQRDRERRFACPFCGKCVRSKENLKLHVRKHTGERPFVCLFCGRAFGGKSDLTRHLRIHTGERPYHCEACGKCFARADYLSKHLTTHVHNAR